MINNLEVEIINGKMSVVEYKIRGCDWYLEYKLETIRGEFKRPKCDVKTNPEG